jgi:hypothetical protein
MTHDFEGQSRNSAAIGAQRAQQIDGICDAGKRGLQRRRGEINWQTSKKVLQIFKQPRKMPKPA